MLPMNYRGPYRVRATQEPEPPIEHPSGAIVQTEDTVAGWPSKGDAIPTHQEMLAARASASGIPVDNGRPPAPGDLPQVIVDLTSPDASSAPALPHERDETVGITGGIQSKTVKQAFEDVQQGRQDTSRAQESNQAYKHLKES